MTVTINDVAREAGVSITTVSRVINNNYPVKKETREKIEKAIEELKYRPNIMARGLITKKTHIVGIIVSCITNFFVSNIIEVIESQLKKNGYSIFLGITDGDQKEEENLVNDLIARQVDGMIIIDPTKQCLKNEFYKDISKKLPLIILNAMERIEGYNYICFNSGNGIKEAFKYLVDLGHKEILFAKGERSVSYEAKTQAYESIREQYNMEYKKELIVPGNGAGINGDLINRTESEFKRFLEDNKKPTAILAANDLIAIGILNYCKKFNIKIPEELSIIGCDNTLISNITVPMISSIDQNVEELSKKASSYIIKLIETQNKSKVHITISSKLIIKESCNKPYK